MSTPMQREWVVPADEYGEVDPDEYTEKVLKAATVVEMCGGVLMIGAQRAEVEEGRYQTQAIVLSYQSFVPAPRVQAAQERAEGPEAEPEG